MRTLCLPLASSLALILLPSRSSFTFIPCAPTPVPLANSGPLSCALGHFIQRDSLLSDAPLMLHPPYRCRSNVTSSERPSVLANHSLTLWSSCVLGPACECMKPGGWGQEGVIFYGACARLHHKYLTVMRRRLLAEGRTQALLWGFLSGVHFSSLG